MARSERQRVAHLLRRAGFGANGPDLEMYSSLGFEGAVDRLVNYEQVDDSDTEDAVAQMRASAPSSSNAQRPALGNPGLEAAVWLARMQLTRRPLQEKMTLFWHGHFTSSIYDVKSADLMYRQNSLYRSMALTGSFRDLTEAVARDPAMLLYLNNNTNRKGAPNENWARELMELFTLGIGNYTEQDVKESARAFTGWTLDLSGNFVFNARQHDSGSKTFLGVTGNLNGDDIIDIILQQAAHPTFIARKLFRFFVYDQPDDATVNRFAGIYSRSGLSIKELVSQLLLSPEFSSDQAYFALVKSPAEFTIGALRALSANTTDVKQWEGLWAAMTTMGQQVYAPPNVGGWPPNRSWVNSNAFYARANLARTLVSINSDLTVDPTEIANAAGVTTSPAAVDLFLDLLLSESTTDYRNTLLQFMGNPGTARQWDGQLRGLVRLIMSSPAYQMN